MTAFFGPLGNGRFVATPHTRGPWDPAHQHAGPPAAPLGRGLERCEPAGGMVLARLTFEILRPVPVGEVAVSARGDDDGIVARGAQALLVMPRRGA